MDRSLLKKFYLPLGFLLAFGSLALVWIGFDLPRDEELIAILEVYFDRYGFWFLFVSAIVESALFVGVYYPGSFVIFLGVVLSGSDIPRVALSVAVVTLGMLIGYAINFFLGKYGWYKLLLRFGMNEPIERAKERLTKYGVLGIFMSYWHPNFAAFVATAAGILRYPFTKFILFSILAAVMWNGAWGTLAYFIGMDALKLMGIRFILLFIISWAIFIAVGSWWKKRGRAEDIGGPSSL